MRNGVKLCGDAGITRGYLGRLSFLHMRGAEGAIGLWRIFRRQRLFIGINHSTQSHAWKNPTHDRRTSFIGEPVLFAGDTEIAWRNKLAIPDAGAALVRAEFTSLKVGTKVDRVQIVGHRTSPKANYFTLMEIRAGALPAK